MDLVKQSKALHPAASNMTTQFPLAHQNLYKFYSKQRESSWCHVCWIYLASSWRLAQPEQSDTWPHCGVKVQPQFWMFSPPQTVFWQLRTQIKGKEGESQNIQQVFISHTPTQF